MKLYFFVLISAITVQSPFAAKSKCRHTKTAFHCVEFVKNYDGDTFTMNIPKVHRLIGQEMKIRLRGVDTPELRSKKPCEKEKAKAIRDYVGQMLAEAKTLSIINISRGKYFRIVADVLIDGKISLQDHLIEMRYAVAYDGGTKTQVNWCEY